MSDVTEVVSGEVQRREWWFTDYEARAVHVQVIPAWRGKPEPRPPLVEITVAVGEGEEEGRSWLTPARAREVAEALMAAAGVADHDSPPPEIGRALTERADRRTT